MNEAEYGYSVEVPEGYDEAIVRTRLALRREGFSILSEMHVGELVAESAGSGRQYLFLGAWSSALSSRPVAGDLQVAVHLSSNVVVQEMERGAVVAALDPADDLEASGSSPEAVDVARAALGRVLTSVQGAA